MTGDHILQVPLTGTVTSARTSSLSPQVSGNVKRIAVEVGDRLRAGDLLLEIDSELESLTLESVRASTEQARAELTDAKRRYENGKELRKKNSISANELDLIKAEVQIKQAAVSKQLAEERRQLATVKRHRVVAPFDGVISERMTEIGEWIDPGDPIFTLVSLEELRAEFRVPQEYFMQITSDSGVSLVFDAAPKQQFAGQIQVIIPVSDPSARTFLIHVILKQADINVTPGMSVHGRLNLSSGQKGVIISRDALLRYPDGRITVWTVSQPQGEATVNEQQLEIGPGFDGMVPVIRGLQAGSYVVVQGNESLQEGQTVRIQQTQ